jgi:hypothetical protein
MQHRLDQPFQFLLLLIWYSIGSQIRWLSSFFQLYYMIRLSLRWQCKLVREHIFKLLNQLMNLINVRRAECWIELLLDTVNLDGIAQNLSSTPFLQFCCIDHMFFRGVGEVI